MQFTVRTAAKADIPDILSIIAEAQGFLKNQGVNQWQNGYPNRQVFEQDIANGHSYVLAAEGRVAGTAALIPGIEGDYNNIYDGAWATPEAYATIHRIAVSSAFRGSGAAAALLLGLQQKTMELGIKGLRVDTHRQNLPMQKFLTGQGFVHRGIIYLGRGAENGAERLAFDKLL